MVKDGEDWHGLQATKFKNNRLNFANRSDVTVLLLGRFQNFNRYHTRREWWVAPMSYTGDSGLMRKVTGHLPLLLEWPTPLCALSRTQTLRHSVKHLMVVHGKQLRIDSKLCNWRLLEGIASWNLVSFNQHLLYSHWTRQASKANSSSAFDFLKITPPLLSLVQCGRQDVVSFHIIIIIVIEFCCDWK